MDALWFFFLLVIGWIIRLLLNLRNQLLIEKSVCPAARGQNTSNNYSAMRLWVWHPYTAFYSVKKRHALIAGIGSGNHLRNTGSAHGKSISTKPTQIQAWIFCTRCCISKGAFLPYQPSEWRRIFCTQDERRPCTLRKGDWTVRIWLHAEYQLEMRQRWIFKEPNSKKISEYVRTAMGTRPEFFFLSDEYEL